MFAKFNLLSMIRNCFSVIMPIFNQAQFVRRAIASLMEQSCAEWELIIVDDGSTDRIDDFLCDLIKDNRITYLSLSENKGIGYALNRGIEIAKYDFIAYLPADDFYDKEHLATLRETLLSNEDIVLAFSGIRYDDSRDSGLITYKNCKGAIPGYSLQLVQVAHRKTADRWTERKECVSEDLFFTFWRKLTDKGCFIPTLRITCEWTNHPYQRHKICGERFGGGLNKYRAFYNVKTPLRFRCTKDKTVDEYEAYRIYREHLPVKTDGLKILIVGELAYNPERILAFEEAGCRLYGLWSKPRFCYSTVGPLPFGNVEDVPYNCWKEKVADIKPDIIYAQLSTSAIELAHEVLTSHTEIPFVWHFKEGPNEAMKAGLWSKIIDLYAYSDGQIFIDEEVKHWFELFLPSKKETPSMILDGDLPKKECFKDDFSPKLSMADGKPHTVVTGRMIGLSLDEYAILAKNGIHVHVYNENHLPYVMSANRYKRIDENHFHVHRHCPQPQWVKEFSKYDAGWLHCLPSYNNGDIMYATWADLNLPARINTLVAAGLPMIQRRNIRNISAQYSRVSHFGMGLFYDKIDELVKQLQNKKLLQRTSDNVMIHRMEFTFDNHVTELIKFFNKVINHTTINRPKLQTTKI